MSLSIQIVIDITGEDTGAPGVARTFPYAKLSPTPTVTLSLADTAGVLSYNWQFIDVPTGSATVMNSPTSATPTFEPDVEGTYLFQCLVNDGEAYDRSAVAFTTENLALRKPAGGETDEFNNVYGWKIALEEMFNLLDSEAITDGDAIHVNVDGEINGISEKPVPVINDILVSEDSADGYSKKKIQIGNLPGLSTDMHGPTIIVGNSVAGDTINNCHYLDTGNGAQLAAAVAAAAGSPAKDVYVRPGTYDFRVFEGPDVPISIPDNVRVRGAGTYDSTTIIGNDGADQRVFVVGNTSELSDVRVEVPFATGPCTSGGPKGAVSFIGGLGIARRVYVAFDSAWWGYAIVEAAWNDLDGAFVGADGSSGRLVECVAEVPPLTDYSVTMYGFRALGPSESFVWRLDRCVFYDADVSIRSQARISISDCEVYGFYLVGIEISHANAAESHIKNSTIELSSSYDSGNVYGITVASVTPRCLIQGNTIDGHASVTGSGILMEGDNGSLVGNVGRNWPTGIELTSNSGSNKVGFNNIGTVTDAGTGNDVAHN